MSYKRKNALYHKEGGDIVRIWRKSHYKLGRYRKRSKWPMVIIISLLILIFLIIYLFNIVENNLQPTIVQMAEAKANLIANEAIHKVLYDKVLANVNYSDLVHVHKDSQQRITMMQANTIKISRIVSQANLEIKESLRHLEDETFQIPLGSALNSQILANYGPRINVKIIPVGTVHISFHDEFEQAGINQVRHILSLDITSTVKIVVPLVTKEISVDNRIPIAETIIVGEVPQTYFGLSNNNFKDIIGQEKKNNK